jgi:SAM-dependent methyltransferase
MSNSVATSLPCNLCGAAEATVVGKRSRSGAPLRSVCCVDCGLVWSDPRPLESRRFYEHDYRIAYKGTFEPKLKHVLRAGRVALDRLAHVRPLLQQRRRVLDVGSGGGEFAHLLQTLGHEVVGVEPNRGYAEFSAVQYGITVTRGFAGDVALPADHFDLITIWHVLEHTDDPSRVLAQLHSGLRPGGSLVVEVPNIEATCQSPRSTFHEAHVFTFSPVTLRRMGEKAGLQVERITLSSDGGNITAVLRRPSMPVAAPASLKIFGEHDRIVGILRAHRPRRHLLTPHPYRRLAGRVARSLQERWQTRNPLPPRALLHQLYSVPRPAAGSAAFAAAHGGALWPLLVIASLIAVILEWILLDLGHIPIPPLQALAGYVATGAVLVASVFVVARRSLTKQRRAVMAVWGVGVLALPAYC